MKPLAAIDIGSNTVHLLVGRPQPHGEVEHVASVSALLELGREVEKHGKVRNRKLAELERVLRDHIKLARKLKARQILIGATQAVRQARNGDRIRKKIEKDLELPVYVLAPSVEARLAFTGARPSLHRGEVQMLIDSGGASTEVTLTRGRSRLAGVSLSVGASALCAKLIGDPPGPLEWARLWLHLADELNHLPRGAKPVRAIAVGGAAHRLEEMSGAQRGEAVHLRDLERIARKLLRHSSKRIAKKSGIERKKVVLLAAGALIIHAILSHYGLESVDIGHQGLRDGMILASSSNPSRWWRPSASRSRGARRRGSSR